MGQTKNTIRNYFFGVFAAALPLALGALVLPALAQAKPISKTLRVGAYSITLKVLPAESFTGPNAAMVRDGGAEANKVNGPENPNHHLVAFVKKNGNAVEHATVDISYKDLSSMSRWMALPVVRMHARGHGLASTHYGNNVRLNPGKYEVRVAVDGQRPATFRFSLRG